MEFFRGLVSVKLLCVEGVSREGGLPDVLSTSGVVLYDEEELDGLDEGKLGELDAVGLDDGDKIISVTVAVFCTVSIWASC